MAYVTEEYYSGTFKGEPVVSADFPALEARAAELVEEMTKRGYKVARRTIAKYRDQLDIPKARLRKEL